MKDLDTVIFISGMYAPQPGHSIESNIEEAKHWAQIFWLMGYTVFCPHLNTAGFKGLVPDQSFYTGDINILLRACDILVEIPNFSKST
ncbi:hypothetical protein LCGC14_1817600, partial [marine sediment metagenome]